MALTHFVWLLAGFGAGSLLGGWLGGRLGGRLGQRRRDPEPATNHAPGPPAAAPVDPQRLVASIADDLATLVSGVEGRAHTLIDRAPHRDELPAAAEGLLHAIGQLRRLHRELAVFATPPKRAEGGHADLLALLPNLVEDLQHLQLGIEVRWQPASHLPAVAVPATVLREALLYAGRILLRAEPGARCLSLEAELALAGDQPVVQVAMVLEWDGAPTGTPGNLGLDAAGQITQTAAVNLLAAHGGDLLVTHRPGHAAEALLVLPIHHQPSPPTTPLAGAQHPRTAVPDADPTAQQAASVPLLHPYGGVLVIEADAAVRTMLATELRAVGRAVFVCADSGAAAALLLATPERFEALIVDHLDRLTDAALAAAMRRLGPQLRVCCTAPYGGERVLPHDVHSMPKPFSRHELRAALAAALARR